MIPKFGDMSLPRGNKVSDKRIPPTKNLSVQRGFSFFNFKKRNYFADFLVEEALLQEELLLLVFLAEAVLFLALPEVADLQEEDLQLLEN